MEESLFNPQNGALAVALCAAVAALWRALVSAHTSRVTALEKAYEECRHERADCERRTVHLAAAIIDNIEGRRSDAIQKCATILKSEAPQE